MSKKINTSTIIIVLVIVGAVGILIWGGSKNKTTTPAVDQHGMPFSVNTSAVPISELMNKPMPDFSFTDREGKVYSRDALRGKNVVLFFNEGLMCYPACWNQIVALARDERFKTEDAVVLSIVADSPQDWQQAINKMPELAEATVVFDNGASASKAFGVLSLASSMHPGSLPGHTYVLIDKEGVIEHIFDDPNMSIHNDQLIAELNKLNQN